MVLRLDCPHCGPRPADEWVYGEVPDPPDYLTEGDERDVDRGFMMSNTEGVKVERWFHAGGCRRWQTITRDTTHRLDDSWLWPSMARVASRLWPVSDSEVDQGTVRPLALLGCLCRPCVTASTDH